MPNYINYVGKRYRCIAASSFKGQKGVVTDQVDNPRRQGSSPMYVVLSFCGMTLEYSLRDLYTMFEEIEEGYKSLEEV